MRSHTPRPVRHLLTVCAATAVCLSARASWAHRLASPVPRFGTAFVNVAVIPMDRERVLMRQTVLVQGGHITALGPVGTVRVPAGVVHVDGRGKFLIPGLADMHMHLQDTDSAGAEEALFLLVANGVTTIRDVDFLVKGGGNGWAKLSGNDLLRLRARAAAGDLVSPRIYTSGRWGGDSPSDTNDQSGGRAADAATAIPRYKAAGYDFIKIHKEDRETTDSVLAVAHRVGIPVVGHVPADMDIEHAISAGYTSIEHLMGYEAYLRQRVARGDGTIEVRAPSAAQSDTIDPVVLHTIAVETQRAHVWNCPTQAVFDNLAMGASIDSLAQRPELRYVNARTLRFWDAFSNLIVTNGGDSFPSQAAVHRQLIKALQSAGAGLLSGTDTWMPYMVAGFSLHHELEALVRAGLTPYQALVTSTRNVAAYFGALDQRGTVTVGKRADLVLLNGNPLLDIRQTAQVAGVMLGGRWLTRAELDQRLAGYAGKLETYMVSPLFGD